MNTLVMNRLVAYDSEDESPTRRQSLEEDGKESRSKRIQNDLSSNSPVRRTSHTPDTVSSGSPLKHVDNSTDGRCTRYVMVIRSRWRHHDLYADLINCTREI
ncbi:hypothetical protein AB6A40_001438 [Gnathostoma spinigerum]|uniref:Uncharacterized protein n=1 Tax=Gnathostoma spinigerum TaxID=75299 RepID=A0ABD6E460_9BILA